MYPERTVMLDFTVGNWQRVVIGAVAEEPQSFEELRVLLRRLGHYPSRSAMTCSVDGLVRREILSQGDDGRLTKGPTWAFAVRRYGASDSRLAGIA